MPSPGRTTSAPPLDAVAQRPGPSGGERPERKLACKHAIDRVAAATLLALAAPVLVFVTLALKLSGPGPVLVRERRVARDGSSFELLAFRPLPFLASWPLDQLPQLFNVLKGELSFVGPRPERPEFVELFGENLRRYQQPRRVKPGITGWAQVRGLQGRPPLAERVRWDDFYVENWSLRLDLKILLMTLRDVCRGAEPSSGD